MTALTKTLVPFALFAAFGVVQAGELTSDDICATAPVAGSSAFVHEPVAAAQSGELAPHDLALMPVTSTPSAPDGVARKRIVSDYVIGA